MQIMQKLCINYFKFKRQQELVGAKQELQDLQVCEYWICISFLMSNEHHNVLIWSETQKYGFGYFIQFVAKRVNYKDTRNAAQTQN